MLKAKAEGPRVRLWGLCRQDICSRPCEAGVPVGTPGETGAGDLKVFSWPISRLGRTPEPGVDVPAQNLPGSGLQAQLRAGPAFWSLVLWV